MLRMKLLARMPTYEMLIAIGLSWLSNSLSVLCIKKPQSLFFLSIQVFCFILLFFVEKPKADIICGAPNIFYNRILFHTAKMPG